MHLHAFLSSPFLSPLPCLSLFFLLPPPSSSFFLLPQGRVYIGVAESTSIVKGASTGGHFGTWPGCGLVSHRATLSHSAEQVCVAVIFQLLLHAPYDHIYTLFYSRYRLYTYIHDMYTYTIRRPNALHLTHLYNTALCTYVTYLRNRCMVRHWRRGTVWGCYWTWIVGQYDSLRSEE